MMMMMMSQRWSFWSIGFGVLPPKSLPFPSIDDDDDYDDDDVAVFAAASRRMRVVHCYRSATAVSMMRAYVLGVRRERESVLTLKQNVSQNLLHFLSKRQKFSLAKKKETTIKKKKTKKKRLLLCAAGSDDGVHHPDIVNFFIASSLRSL